MVMMQMHVENQLKKQKMTIFYCNLESKSVSMHLRYQCMNSRLSTSALFGTLNMYIFIFFPCRQETLYLK